MSLSYLAAEGGPTLTGGDRGIVVVVAVIALAALAVYLILFALPTVLGIAAAATP